MSEEVYRSLVFAQREDRNREYKQSFPWDRKSYGETLAKVTKSILAMGNLRDGGHIIIGVEETTTSKGIQYKPVGVQDEHLSTFTYDGVADFIRKYADPYVSFDLDVVTLDNMNFVIVAVAGFDEFPVICKDNFADILANGVIYCRSKSGRPKSERISNYADMRELMDLAIERGVRRFIRTQVRISEPGVSDQDQFEHQLGDFS